LSEGDAEGVAAERAVAGPQDVPQLVHGELRGNLAPAFEEDHGRRRGMDDSVEIG